MEVSANLHVGCRVQATTKDDVKIGKVAFIGLTSFAPGKCCFIICSLMVNFCYILHTRLSIYVLLLCQPNC